MQTDNKATQSESGGLNGIWVSDIKNFIAANLPTNADDIICDWLKNYPAKIIANVHQVNSSGMLDGKKNGNLWRKNVNPVHLDLFVLTFIRAP